MDGRPRVLVVDDERGVRESLRAILEGDYEVRLASSGEEALGVLGREPVDVVTVDLRMPGLGGLAVLERIKQRDPDIEVLIITGNGCFESARQGLRHHAFDYLTKPFDAEHVRRVVQHAVDRRAAVRRLKAGPESPLAQLSHEFRTPLNVIVGYSSMLREEGASTLTQEQQLALDRIQANSGTLLGYVETLFYRAELDRGRVPLATSPVRVAAVLARVHPGEHGRHAHGARRERHAPAIELRPVEERLHVAEQGARVGLDAVERELLLLRERARALLAQHARVADDHVERRPELVRQLGEEALRSGLEAAHGRAAIDRALHDAADVLGV